MRAYRIRLGNLPEDGCGELWEKCREYKCVAIGWGDLGDLCQYTTDDELRTGLRKMLGDHPWLGEGWIKMSLPQIKCFNEVCTIDDFVIAYFKGQICGIGQVKRDYYYNENERYRINMIPPQTKNVIDVLFYHQRKVEWKKFDNSPLKVKDLKLSQHLKNKLNTPPTIIDISSEEWDEITSELNFPV